MKEDSQRKNIHIDTSNLTKYFSLIGESLLFSFMIIFFTVIMGKTSVDMKAHPTKRYITPSYEVSYQGILGNAAFDYKQADYHGDEIPFGKKIISVYIPLILKHKLIHLLGLSIVMFFILKFSQQYRIQLGEKKEMGVLSDENEALKIEKKRELDAKIKVIKEMEVSGLKDTSSARKEISKLKKDFEVEVESLIEKSDEDRKIQVLKDAFEQGIVSKEEYEYRVKIKEELTPKYKKMLQDEELSVKRKIEDIRNGINVYTVDEREEKIKTIKENYAQKVNEYFELSKKEIESKKEKS